MFPDWTWIVGLWIGACIGSFLNVVIYRLPRGLSIGKPTHSFCPNCKTRLGLPDLMPLLSWLFLKGKCRHCGNKVAARYFIVELINGILFAVIWYQQLIAGDDPIKAIGYSLFAACLVAAIFTDIEHYIIPDQINACMLLIGIGMNIALALQPHHTAYFWKMPSSMIGALAGIGVLWGIAFLGRVLFGKDAMGHGDIKMARGIGAVLLPVLSLISFALAVVLGAVLGIILIIVRKVRESKNPVVEEEEEEDLPPETIGSLLWCGLGYVLCIDVFGLVFPKLYEWWFAENPYSVEAFEEDPEVELTVIPFGPYLAAGALGAVLFGPQLLALVASYWNSVGGSR